MIAITPYTLSYICSLFLSIGGVDACTQSLLMRAETRARIEPTFHVAGMLLISSFLVKRVHIFEYKSRVMTLLRNLDTNQNQEHSAKSR